jgi:class 3 adenylate cyclase
MGMSQRDAIDFSVEAAERDLDAVVDRLGLDRFALYGHVTAGMMPLQYAARHPDRVSCLAYWIGQTVGLSPEIMRRLALIDPLIDQDWDLYVNLRARVMFGWDSTAATPFAALLRAAHTPESFRRGNQTINAALVAADPPEAQRLAALGMRVASGQDKPAAPAYLTHIRAPSLVFHLLGSAWTTSLAGRLAAQITTAHVVAIPGPSDTLSPFLYDNEVLLRAICDFVEETWSHPEAPVTPPELQLAAMRAILWTDIEGHSIMMERLGDAKGRDVLRDHELIAREALAAHGGTEVKSMGDGFMAWFPSAQRAVECAIALQRSFALHNDSSAEPLSVRVGVNAGEPIAEEDDLFGASVITAARICSQAAGGEILASDVVRQLVAGKGFAFADRGAVALKGFEEPVRLYEVRWQED